MLHGSLKGTLLDILEKLDTGRNMEGYTKGICMPVRTGIAAYTEADYSKPRECRLLKNWTGLRVVPTWLTNFTILFHRAYI